MGARGIKEFVADLTSADAALGRFSRNLGQSPQMVAGWGMAAERMGGSAEATSATLERMGKALYELHRNGQMLPKEFSQLQALSGKNIDTEHGLARYAQTTAAALKEMAKIDPAQAHFLAQGLNIDDGTANLMIKYGDAVDKYAGNLGDTLGPSNDAIKAAQELQEKWATLQQMAVSLATTIYADLAPQITAILAQMTDWLDKNQAWIESDIAHYVGEFVKELPELKKELSGLATDADAIATAFGGWSHVVEGLVIALVALKALQVASMVANISRAFGGGAAAATIASEIKGGAAPSKPSTRVSGPGIGSLLFGALGAYNLVDNIPTDPDELKKFMAENGQRSQGWNKWLEDNVGTPRSWLGLDGAADKNTSGSPDDRDGKTTPYGAPKTIAQQISEKAGTIVNGRPVDKGNPMPVVMADSDSGGSSWLAMLTDPNSTVGKIANSIGSAVHGIFGGEKQSGPVASIGASAGERGWWTKARQQHMYDRLTKEGGFSDQGAKAAISRAANVEASGGPSTVNSIGAIGYIQALGARKKRMLQMAQEKGVPWQDFDLQIDHMLEETKGSENKAGQRFRSAKTAAEGAIAASTYERAEGYNSLTGTDNFTGRTMGGMRGIEKYVGSVLSDRATAGRLNATNNNDNRSTSSSSHEMHVGAIHVNAPNAKDSDSIASKITDSLYRSSVAATANYGPK